MRRIFTGLLSSCLLVLMLGISSCAHALASVKAHPPCSCQAAPLNALITHREMIPPATRERLSFLGILPRETSSHGGKQ